MMGITEKVAYLQGLLKGLEIDETTKEGKLLVALVDVVDEMAASIADLEMVYDSLEEDLSELEEEVYELTGEDYDDYDFDEDNYDDCDCCSDEDDLYEIICPKCNDQIYLNEEMLEEGSMSCPNCGENLEFDYSDDE